MMWLIEEQTRGGRKPSNQGEEAMELEELIDATQTTQANILRKICGGGRGPQIGSKRRGKSLDRNSTRG